MLNAVRQNVTVQQGGRIEIFVPEIRAGARAEVIVIESPESAGTPRSPLAKLVGAGKGAFASPADVDAFIRAEREQWP
jgi:hypothetical protein